MRAHTCNAHMYMHMYMYTCVPWKILGSQKTTCSTMLSHFTMWVMGLKLRLLGSMAGTFIHRVVLVAASHLAF